MVATVIRIPEEEYQLYKQLAHEKGVSLAEYFRQAARKTAGISKKKPKEYSIFDLGTRIVSRTGPKNGSVNHDKYYYDWEDKKRRMP